MIYKLWLRSKSHLIQAFISASTCEFGGSISSRSPCKFRLDHLYTTIYNYWMWPKAAAPLPRGVMHGGVLVSMSTQNKIQQKLERNTTGTTKHNRKNNEHNGNSWRNTTINDARQHQRTTASTHNSNNNDAYPQRLATTTSHKRIEKEGKRGKAGMREGKGKKREGRDRKGGKGRKGGKRGKGNETESLAGTHVCILRYT